MSTPVPPGGNLLRSFDWDVPLEQSQVVAFGFCADTIRVWNDGPGDVWVLFCYRHPAGPGGKGEHRMKQGEFFKHIDRSAGENTGLGTIGIYRETPLPVSLRVHASRTTPGGTNPTYAVPPGIYDADDPVLADF